MTITNEIKDSLKEKKLIIGTRAVIKQAKNGNVKVIIHSSSITEALLNTLDATSHTGGIELKRFDGNSVQLAQICGKPFKILSVGIRK